MFIRPIVALRSAAGFTIVEVVIALLLSALGGLALMATHDYFTRARMNIESRAAHTNLRNLVVQTLSRKGMTCSGTPPVCMPDTCLSHLKLRDAIGEVRLTAAKATSTNPVSDPITEADAIELAIVAARPDGTTYPVVASTDPAHPPNPMEQRDHQRYRVFLTGNFKEDSSDEREFSGSLQLVGKRTGDNVLDLTASIPLRFKVKKTAPYNVTQCEVRTEGRPIAGGNNSVDDCQAAGGVPVATEIGMLCRFRSPLQMQPLASMCPSGFQGDPAIGCTVDPDADSEQSYGIPACPPITTGKMVLPPGPFTFPTPVNGVPDTGAGRGKKYCKYDIAPLGLGTNVTVGDCPVSTNPDPDIAAVEGWYDRSLLPTGDADHVAASPTVLQCRYFNRPSDHAFVCETTATTACTMVNEPIPPGDGISPYCQCPITQCPNLDENGAPISPAPWTQISAYPNLKCKRNPYYNPPPGATAVPAQCGPGFSQLPNSVISAVHSLSEWITYSSAGTNWGSEGASYVLCR